MPPRAVPTAKRESRPVARPLDRAAEGRDPADDENPTVKTFWLSLEEYLAHANPNPKRIGCPQQKHLQQQAQARRQDDTIIRHVFECSPCYRVYSQFLRGWLAEFRAKSLLRRKRVKRSGSSGKQGAAQRVV